MSNSLMANLVFVDSVEEALIAFAGNGLLLEGKKITVFLD